MENFLWFLSIIALGCALIIHMWREAFQNRIISITLEYDDFPDPVDEVKIFFISDIHRRLVDRSIVESVKGKADLVIIGGDLAEKGVPFSQIRENLRRLRQIGPVYFIWGNNDYELGREELRKLFLEEGIAILENDHVLLPTKSGKAIALIGIGEIAFEDADLHGALAGVGREMFKIVCCHNPKVLDMMDGEENVHLTLCGHTHGGQINLFGIAPYPLGGYFRLEQTDVLITNGYGTTWLPLRFRARAETHLITIKKR